MTNVGGLVRTSAPRQDAKKWSTFVDRSHFGSSAQVAGICPLVKVIFISILILGAQDDGRSTMIPAPVLQIQRCGRS